MILLDFSFKPLHTHTHKHTYTHTSSHTYTQNPEIYLSMRSMCAMIARHRNQERTTNVPLLSNQKEVHLEKKACFCYSPKEKTYQQNDRMLIICINGVTVPKAIKLKLKLMIFQMSTG